MGKTGKLKAREKLAGGGGAGEEKGKRKPPFLSPVSSRFIFVLALFQFSWPEQLGAWNRLT